MNARIKLVVALLVGVVVGVLARAFGYTDVLVNAATVVTVVVLFLGGFWWIGRTKVR